MIQVYLTLTYQSECDPEKVAAKLDLYNSSCPHTSQIANYWLCRAKIAQQEKDFDRVVCLLEQAFVFKAQVIHIFSPPRLKDAILVGGEWQRRWKITVNTSVCFSRLSNLKIIRFVRKTKSLDLPNLMYKLCIIVRPVRFTTRRAYNWKVMQKTFLATNKCFSYHVFSQNLC